MEGLSLKTKEERKKYQRNWFLKNKRHCAEYYEEYRWKTKLEMIAAYGGKCSHCGETDPIILTIDHIFNDGHQDKKRGIEGGFKLYRKLKKQNWPTDRFQLLCFNCNFKKEWYRRKDAFQNSKSS